VLEPDGQHARRVVVEYGRQSGSFIEIVTGLSEGDRVIVTDMSRWAGHDRVRLK
jgi:multidrug efflux pump subunit AcrA (membrane-fusion protein)